MIFKIVINNKQYDHQTGSMVNVIFIDKHQMDNLTTEVDAY